MATRPFFKKRRGKSGPSKNEQKIMRGQQAEQEAQAAGTLSSRFPNVKRLDAQLTFLDEGRPLDYQEKRFDAGTPAIFKVDCPGMCGRGVFDYTPFVNSAAQSAQPLLENKLTCPEMQSNATPCGCELKIRLQLAY
jgi:hypothetical protein